MLAAPDHAQIEIDARTQQILRGSLADERRKTPRPFGPGQAQLGVAGHDIALAQGEAAQRQALVDLLGNGQQLAANLGGMGRIPGFEQNAVVLIGVQGLLATAFAAETQPAERHAGVAFFGEGQFDHPAHGVVVEQGDDVGDLRRRRAVGQHALDQLTDFAPQRHQVFHFLGIADGARQVHQVDPLQGKQIALGNHAAQALVLDQADMGNVTLGHGNRRVECTVIRRQEERRPGHVPFDGFVEITAAVGHGLAQVAQGENPQWRLEFIDHHDAADLLFVHQRHGFAQWRLRGACHRVAHGQFAQSGIERILGAQGFHGFLLHLLVDLIQQAADAAQGEVAEGVR
ncbi:hypothetical protein D3C86_1306640 [compost metagenome]